MTNSDKLGNYNASEYAKLNSPNFVGTPKVPNANVNGLGTAVVNINVLKSYVQQQLNRAWPIGSIYISVSAANPATTIGGQWRRIGEGRCLIGVGESDGKNIALRQTGGKWSITLKSDNIPSHNHDINISATGSTDGAGNHNHRTGFGSQNGGAARYGHDGSRGVGTGDTDYDNFNYYTSTEGWHSHSINFRVIGKSSSFGSANPTPVPLEIPYIGVYMWERVS